MRPPDHPEHSAFSLLETVIAVGIFAIAIAAILGLLPSITRQAGRSSGILVSSHLPDAILTELQRMVAAGGFDAVAAQAAPLGTPPPATCRLVADHEGSRIHALDFQPPPATDQLEAGAQYFLIEAWTFPAAPLAFEPDGAVLALHVRVSWPYRVPGSSGTTSISDRDQLSFNLALNR